MARPPSRLYELQKSVRRHKFGFAAAGAIVLVLVAGVVVSTLEAVRATRAERVAEAEAARSAQVAQFLKDMLKAAGPSVARGRDATLLREVLEKTATRVETDIKGQPEVQGDLWFTLGMTYSDVGDRKQAIPMFESAGACYRTAFGGKHPKLALSLCKLGACQSFINNVPEGSSNAQSGLEIARACGDPDTLATCLHDMARALTHAGMIVAGGEPLLREAVEIRRRLANDPVALAGCLSAWGLSKRPFDEGAIREALEIYEEHLEPDHPKIGSERFVLGQVLLDDKRPVEAEAVLRQATELLSRVWDEHHPYQHLVRRFLARALLHQGKAREAEDVLRDGMQHGLTYLSRREYLDTLAEALVMQGRGNEVESVLSKTFGTDVSESLYSVYLGPLKAYRGDWVAAAKSFSRAVKDNPGSEEYRFNLAIALLKSKQEAEYRLSCGKFLDLAATNRSDLGTVGKAAEVSLLLPVSGADFRRAADLADLAVALERSQASHQWTHLVKALVEYRRGNYNKALDWANRVVSSKDAPDECQAGAWFVLASSEACLGLNAAGHTALKNGDGLVSKPRNRLGNCGDWAVAEHLRQEAVAQLEAPSGDAEQGH